jgi:AraC-like DNA-binding protein
MSTVERSEHVVMLACFGTAPVARTLRDGVGRYGTILHVDDRRSIRKQLCASQPAVVLFPLVDQRGLTTRPLVECALREAPDALTVVCVPPGSSTRGLADVIQLGARLLAWPTDAELQHAVDELLLPAPFDDDDQRALDAMLDQLVPPRMVGLVRHCTLFAHQRLSVASLTRALGVSRRTLNRATHRAGWPSPSDMIGWGRVLRASVIRRREHDDVADVARLAGFRNSQALASALERYLGAGTTLDDLEPLHINRAIRSVVSRGRGADGVAPSADDADRCVLPSRDVAHTVR